MPGAPRTVPLPPRPPRGDRRDRRAALAAAALSLVALALLGGLLLLLGGGDDRPAAGDDPLAAPTRSPSPILTVPPAAPTTPPPAAPTPTPTPTPTPPPPPVPTPDGGQDVAFVRAEGEVLVTDRVQVQGGELLANDNPQERRFALREDAVLVAGPQAAAVLGRAPGPGTRAEVLALLADPRSAELLLTLTYDEVGQVVRVEEF